MKRETYDYIWEEIIYENIKSLCEKYSNTVSVKHNPYNVELLKEEIFEKYNFEKKRLKELYHCGTEEEERIDIHKIAACFTKVILKAEIFEYSLKQEIEDDVFLINAKLAYSVGLGLIKMNLVFFYLELQKKDIAEKLVKLGELKVPPTNPGHDEYNLGRCKTLALNEVFDNEFDILTYSDMMFWIELYNRQILEDTIVPCVFPVDSRMCDSFD